MKLPRWLVIAMLTSSVLSVLAAAGWWWVTWPERNAREVVSLLETGRIEDAQDEFRLPDIDVFLLLENHGVKGRRSATLANLKAMPRTWWDVLSDKHQFVIDGEVALTATPWGVSVRDFELVDSPGRTP